MNEDILRNARAVAEGAEPPRYPSTAYEDEALAADPRRFAKAVRDGDPDVVALLLAARVARAPRGHYQTIQKRVELRERAYTLVEHYAKSQARPGESAERAMARLVREQDQTLLEAIAAYQEL